MARSRPGTYRYEDNEVKKRMGTPTRRRRTTTTLPRTHMEREDENSDVVKKGKTPTRRREMRVPTRMRKMRDPTQRSRAADRLVALPARCLTTVQSRN
ncbi:hypothetical protein PC114_g18480 [Phytophthora cactorum]|nr:hypothetical protein PC114_g18480 [Phytophthora cactorum]KAG4046068.1 hypothetical protein PC123_g18553 [Phytophthora cactorum]